MDKIVIKIIQHTAVTKSMLSTVHLPVANFL